MKRRGLRRGVCIDLGLILLAVSALFVTIGWSYDGTCRGVFPTVSASGPCSFFHYVSGSMVLYTLILGTEFWPFLLGVLLLPPLIGYLLDRRS